MLHTDSSSYALEIVKCTPFLTAGCISVPLSFGDRNVEPGYEWEAFLVKYQFLEKSPWI
jgi:hypothetical protein